MAEPVEWWRPTRGLAHALTWVLAALAVMQFLTPSIVDRGDQFERQHRALVAVFDGRWRAAGRILRHTNNGPPGWGYALSLLSLAASVLLIVWTWRSMHNTLALGRTGARLSPGWAIAGWLIPFASLVLPYILLSDLWRSSSPTAAQGDRWQESPGSGLVRAYWSAHIAGAVFSLSVVVAAVSGSIHAATARPLTIVTGAIVAAATLASIAVVLSITTRQETQARADPPPTERPLAATVHAAGWYDDPSGQFDHRYWDGDHWTDHVTTRGVRSVAHVTPAGWYPDPTGRFHWRYWTGTEWTEHVSRDDELFVDPV